LLSYFWGFLRIAGLPNLILYIVYIKFVFKYIFRADEKQADNYALKFVDDFEQVKSVLSDLHDGNNKHTTTITPILMWKMTEPNEGYKRYFLYVTWFISRYLKHVLLFFSVYFVLISDFNFFLSLIAYIFLLMDQILLFLYKIFNINATFFVNTRREIDLNIKVSGLRISAYKTKSKRIEEMQKMYTKKNRVSKSKLLSFAFHLLALIFFVNMLVFGILSGGTISNLPGPGVPYNRCAYEISQIAYNSYIEELYSGLEHIHQSNDSGNTILFDLFKDIFNSPDMENYRKYDVEYSLQRFIKQVKIILQVESSPIFTMEFYKDITRYFIRVHDSNDKTLFYAFCKRPQTVKNIQIGSVGYFLSMSAARIKIKKNFGNIRVEEAEPFKYFVFLKNVIKSYNILFLMLVFSIFNFIAIRLKVRKTVKTVDGSEAPVKTGKKGQAR
jgi:hypothetical protein